MNAMVEATTPKAFLESGVTAGAAAKPLVPTTFEGAYRIGQVLANSRMAPNGMNTAEACTIAIMHGLEIGLMPMQAVQSIAVVNGRPTIWGDAAKALCISSSECEDIIEAIDGEGDKMVAICTAKRKGKSPSVQRFSVDDAKKADLWSKSGPWKQYPKRMLQLRARAFALRDAFPDVLKGLAIREEMEDVVEAKDITPPPPPPSEPPKQVASAKPSHKPQQKVESVEPKVDTPPPPPPLEGEIIPPTKTTGAGNVSKPAEQEPSTSAPADDMNAGELLDHLESTIASAATPELVQEAYDFLDIESRLEGIAGAVERARAIKERRLAQFAAAAAADEPGPVDKASEQFESEMRRLIETAYCSSDLAPAKALWDESTAHKQAIGPARTEALRALYADRHRRISNGTISEKDRPL